MVLDYVPHNPVTFIELSAMLDADIFRHCYLYVVYKASVPYLFEYGIRKSEEHDILHSLFSKVVVYAVNLGFSECLSQYRIQCVRRCTVHAERLFDNYLGVEDPFAEVEFLQSLHDFGGRLRRHGHIINNSLAVLIGFDRKTVELGGQKFHRLFFSYIA